MSYDVHRIMQVVIRCVHRCIHDVHRIMQVVIRCITQVHSKKSDVFMFGMFTWEALDDILLWIIVCRYFNFIVYT